MSLHSTVKAHLGNTQVLIDVAWRKRESGSLKGKKSRLNEFAASGYLLYGFYVGITANFRTACRVEQRKRTNYIMTLEVQTSHTGCLGLKL